LLASTSLSASSVIVCKRGVSFQQKTPPLFPTGAQNMDDPRGRDHESMLARSEQRNLERIYGERLRQSGWRELTSDPLYGPGWWQHSSGIIRETHQALLFEKMRAD